MDSFLFLSAEFTLIFLPLTITIVEWDHYWTKLYNGIVYLYNKVFKKNKPFLIYKKGLNSKEHQIKTFKRWLFIGFIIEVLIIVAKGLL